VFEHYCATHRGVCSGDTDYLEAQVLIDAVEAAFFADAAETETSERPVDRKDWRRR
jgi:hypothetical protein